MKDNQVQMEMRKEKIVGKMTEAEERQVGPHVLWVAFIHLGAATTNMLPGATRFFTDQTKPADGDHQLIVRAI